MKVLWYFDGKTANCIYEMIVLFLYEHSLEAKNYGGGQPYLPTSKKNKFL